MIGSKYAADRWIDIQQDKVAPASMGASASCAAGSSTNVDVVLTDDMFVVGLEFIAVGALVGDTVTLQVIDTNGVVSPPGTVIMTPVSNWNVSSDQQMFLKYQAITPKKVLGTMTIRAIYTSTSFLSPVILKINYIFLKVLS